MLILRTVNVLAARSWKSFFVDGSVRDWYIGLRVLMGLITMIIVFLVRERRIVDSIVNVYRIKFSCAHTWRDMPVVDKKTGSRIHP